MLHVLGMVVVVLHWRVLSIRWLLLEGWLFVYWLVERFWLVNGMLINWTLVNGMFLDWFVISSKTLRNED